MKGEDEDEFGNEEENVEKENSGTSCREMTQRYKDVYSSTRNHRAAVRAYCGNNKWAIENAKGTGNW